MSSYLFRRLLALIPTVLAALTLLFALFFLLPGDPARRIAGGERPPTEEVLERVEERYGLDDPVVTQYGRFLGNAVQWDLGESYVTGRSVNDLVGDRVVSSLRLGFWAILLEIVFGVGLGVVSAVRRRSLADRFGTLLTAAATAVPVFVLGFLLKWAFAIQPHRQGWPEWLRLRTQGIGPDSWVLFVIPTGDQWRYLVLPAVTLAAASAALAARTTRASVLDVLRAEYLRTARAKGLRERQVIWRHALRNALLPIVTLVGLDLGTMVGAAILTETVFSWPGVGSEIARAVAGRDMPVLLGLTTVVILAYAVINLVVDLGYGAIDPRLARRRAARS